MLSCFTGKRKSIKSKSKTVPDTTMDKVNKNIVDKNSNKSHGTTTKDQIDLSYYNISDTREKKLFIFNHLEFDEELEFEPRTGTNEDCDRLIETFNALGFQSQIFQDMTFEEIKKNIDEASELDRKDVNCIVVIVLTYGINNALWAKDQKYSMDRYIMMPFVNSQTLAGVPKLFFIQAMSELETDSAESSKITIPKFADVLWVYSKIEDNVSLEYEEGCNVFIQTLCDCLNEETLKSFNILQILTLVNRRLCVSLIAHNPECVQESVDYVDIELPHYKSTLTKLLKFTRIIIENEKTY